VHHGIAFACKGHLDSMAIQIHIYIDLLTQTRGGKKKQTKADKGREKYIRELEVYTYHAHLMGLWNRELRLSQGLRCAWILLHPRLRMEKSMNELRRCK
jgi:hypothetical protein